MDLLSRSGIREVPKEEHKIISYSFLLLNHPISFILTLRLQKRVTKEWKADVTVHNEIKGKTSAVTLLSCSLKTQLTIQPIHLPLASLHQIAYTVVAAERHGVVRLCFLLSIEGERANITSEERLKLLVQKRFLEDLQVSLFTKH